ncbi:DinB family protein, partial [Flavobacteriaceae bacterium]|nr:DinB family protein [Flavobacteriaceae bacterium]
MDWNYNVTLQNRKLLSKFLEKFSLDQLNKIPEGYRNSVFWNIAHTIVTQQMLVYGLSNTPFLIDADLVNTYKKGTKTAHEATETELALIKSLLFST